MAELDVKRFLKFGLTFLSESTIHGLCHLSAKGRHPFERLIWLAFLAAAVAGAVNLSKATWKRYQENPTVISMERDRFSWNTSFPAATICPSVKLDEEMLDDFVDKTEVENKTQLREFIVALAESGYENFDSVPLYDGIPSSSYMSILVKLLFGFDPSVSNSGASGFQYNLEKVITEMGICYAFNSKLALYSHPNYWKSGRWDLVQGNETFYVHPLDGEVFANIVNMSTGFTIYIHGPYELADAATKPIVSENGYFLQVYLTALTIFSNEKIRDLSVGQRQCRFHDESNLKHSPVYSYKLCLMECRIRLAKQLCGCMPHFYRKLDGDRICDVSGLHCLARYSERLVKVKKECKCVPNCDEVNYVVEDSDTREWFLGSNLQWGLKEYPRMRLKRDVLFGFTDLLVYVGGMAGLFLGCSVLSFIEILYFLTVRLFWFAVSERSRVV